MNTYDRSRAHNQLAMCKQKQHATENLLRPIYFDYFIFLLIFRYFICSRHEMIARMLHANYKTQSRTVTSQIRKIQHIPRL